MAGKPEGKRPVGRPRIRWEDNIKKGKWGWRVYIGFIWLSIGTGGGLL
jgi:hypothetical protein